MIASDTDDKLGVANAVLAAIGEKIGSDFDSDLDRFTALRQFYETVVRSALAQAPWRFAVRETGLVENFLAASADPKWSSGWTSPNDLLRPLGLRINGSPAEYEFYVSDGDVKPYFFCRADPDKDTVTLRYIHRADEQYWAAEFTDYVVARLAAIMCRGFLNNASEAREWQRASMTRFRIAANLHAQSHTARRIDTSRFLRRRRMGGLY